MERCALRRCSGGAKIFFVLLVTILNACASARAPEKTATPAPPPLAAPILYAQALRHSQLGEFTQRNVKLAAAAEQGHLPSQLWLCKLYMDDLGWPDYRVGFSWCERAAEQGDSEAMRMVGVYFAHGIGVPANQATAIVWYRAAADKGNADAMFDLAWRYEIGDGVAQDIPRAVEWYRAAAQLGHPAAQKNLHNIERDGAEFTVKKLAALPGLQEAREGDPEAQFQAAMRFLIGASYLTRSSQQALFWLARARQGGHEKASRLLERFVASSIAPNTGLELHLLQIAAAEGDTDAMYAMGDGYRRGASDIPKDVTLGVKWLEEAANKGHSRAAADLGFYEWTRLNAIAPYKSNITASTDRKMITETYAKAKKYLQMAVDLGDPWGLYGTGSLLIWEFGEKDVKAWRQIVELDRKASAQGVLPATGRLVNSLLLGHGVPKDRNTAVRLLEENLVWGPEYPYFFVYYGEILLKGDGIPMDQKRGVEYLERAGNAGVPHVCLILRDYYRDQGTPEALRKAMEWEDRGRSLRGK